MYNPSEDPSASHIMRVCDNKFLSELDANCVHLTVTSPPYVTTEFRKGQSFDYYGFLEEFEETCRAIYRVTAPGGRFALNVADMVTKYRDGDDYMGRAPFGADTLKAAERTGFRLLERFIWDKGYTRNFKGPLLGSYPYPLTIFNNNYFEYIYILRKPGSRRTRQSIREASRFTLDDWRLWSQQWWRIESITERIDFHRAVFPLEVPLRLIKMYSYIGDLILDPYAGTGATSMAAFLSGRNSLGFEKDTNCKTLVSKRIAYEHKKLPQLAGFRMKFIEEKNNEGTGQVEEFILEA